MSENIALSFFGYTFISPVLFLFGIIFSFVIVYISFFRAPTPVTNLLGIEKRNNFKGSDFFLLLLGFAQFISLFLLSVSAAGPIKTKKIRSNDMEVRDIYFVVDVSRSMLADDFNPNRLGVAKKYIKEFIELRSDDRIGLNIFAEKIITLSPLTLDHRALLEKVNDVSVGFLGNGTNIGDAIALGVSRLIKSATKSKILILLTDGVSNAGSISPIHAGEIAVEKNVKVYGIGIGTEGDAYLPYRVGNRMMKQKIPGGNIDHDTLQKISTITGGKYFKAGSENALKNIFYEINELEKTNIKINSPSLIKFEYLKFLLPGVFLFLITEMIRRFLFRFSL